MYSPSPSLRPSASPSSAHPAIAVPVVVPVPVVHVYNDNSIDYIKLLADNMHSATYSTAVIIDTCMLTCFSG